MNRPAMSDILQKGQSYYSLVIGVSKRARTIVDDILLDGEIVDEKPVSLAVEELAEGKYRLIEPSHIGDCIE